MDPSTREFTSHLFIELQSGLTETSYIITFKFRHFGVYIRPFTYQGSGASFRTHSSGEHAPPSLHSQAYRPPRLVSNGTGGYYPEYPDHRSHSHSSSMGSMPMRGPGSTSNAPGPSHLSSEYSFPHSESSRVRRSSRDDDAQAYMNAKMAAAALPAYLKPEYGEGYLRLDSDGVVKSGTLEALVERLTVDPLSEFPCTTLFGTLRETLTSNSLSGRAVTRDSIPYDFPHDLQDLHGRCHRLRATRPTLLNGAAPNVD